MDDGQPSPRPRLNASQMVAEARTRIENLSVEEVQAEIAAGNVTLIDIRDPYEQWEKGTIPGARSLPRGMLEFWFDPESRFHLADLDQSSRYVLFCAGGGRSALAADTLQDLGYTNVAHLRVGFNGWLEAGGDVERVTPDPKYFTT